MIAEKPSSFRSSSVRDSTLAWRFPWVRALRTEVRSRSRWNGFLFFGLKKTQAAAGGGR